MKPPFLTDSVIFLRSLGVADGPAHLAGEDEEIALYLSGGKSSEDTVQAYIRRCLEHWQSDGPIRAFGVFSCANSSLIGSIEANLSLPTLKPGQVNLSYGIFSKWRGRGIAVRAVRLMCEYLRTTTNAQEAIVRTAPSNQASAQVARKAGFRLVPYESAATPMLTYSLDLRNP